MKTLIESFQYPRKGPGMMWEAAAQKTVERGGRVLMGRDMQRLAYDAKRGIWRIEVANCRRANRERHGTPCDQLGAGA